MSRGDAFYVVGFKITGDPDAVPSVPDANELELVECCYDLSILVEKDNPAVQDPKKNDKTSYFDYFDLSINSATMILAKCVDGAEVDQVTITDNTYGTFSDFGVETHDGNNYISLKNINWTLIYDTFGAGRYQFRIETTSVLPSTTTTPRRDFVYNVQEFTNLRANTTVFMKHFNTGNFAELRTNGATKFTYPDNWEDGKRLSSIFGNDTDEMEESYTVYNDGSDEPVERKIIPKYTWELDDMPQNIKQYVQFVVRSAKRVEMTNYQNNNPTKHDTISVQATGGFDPEYIKQYSKSGVVIEFKHYYPDNFTVKQC